MTSQQHAAPHSRPWCQQMAPDVHWTSARSCEKQGGRPRRDPEGFCHGSESADGMDPAHCHADERTGSSGQHHSVETPAPQPVMRWFTRHWHEGELTDDEVEQAIRDYAGHLTELVPRLPPDVRALTRLNLHDGQVQEWTTTDVGFAWRLLIGDLQRGYQYAEISYSDAELVGTDGKGLRDLNLTGSPFELVSDEVDVALDGRYEHRFYFWPGHEFGVRFGSVSVHFAPPPGTPGAKVPAPETPRGHGRPRLSWPLQDARSCRRAVMPMRGRLSAGR